MSAAGIGHNRGPTMERGYGWRKHCWGQARRDLLPHLPLEVIRGRVRRAREIGLDYATYATVRATTSRDVTAFLFSSNALRLMRETDRLSAERARKLAGIVNCGRALLAHAPLDAERLAAEILADRAIGFDGAGAAPAAFAPWREIRAGVLGVLGPARIASDGVVVVGDTASEREWCAAGRLAGYIAAERYFAPASA